MDISLFFELLDDLFEILGGLIDVFHCFQAMLEILFQSDEALKELEKLYENLWEFLWHFFSVRLLFDKIP